eukprot:comp22646_c0_seq1/m.34898 comp22646_c0_seq1/g.34898  ORF comp22646_c0_seq1/g.34898 comp22646_c0_seq1/m.34898 type:complete len:848 (-) comp22646_c0_seq1:122-2665(-)
MLVKPIYSPMMAKDIPTGFKVMRVSDVNQKVKPATLGGQLHRFGERVEKKLSGRKEEEILEVHHIGTGETLMQNDHFCLGSWHSWHFFAKASSQYNFFVLLKDNGPKVTQKYRIVAQAKNLETAVKDWNTINENILPKLAGVQGVVSVLEVEKMLQQMREEVELDMEDSEQLESAEGFRKILRLKHYKIIKSLGEGSYGQVKLAEDLNTGTKVALKLVFKSAESYETELEEVKLMQGLVHPFVIRLLEMIDKESFLCIALSYAPNGSLTDFISSCENCIAPLDKACHYFNQICMGVAYLHSQMIAHRDLKPDNILLDERGNVKITDFGASARVESKDTVLAELVGTIYYCAPELGEGAYLGFPCDVWSSGVILFNLTTGMYPFIPNTDDVVAFLAAVKRSQLQIPPTLDPQVAEIIRSMMRPEPIDRLTMEEVLQSKWFDKEKAIYDASVKDSVHSDEAVRNKLREDAQQMVQDFVHTCQAVEEEWQKVPLETTSDGVQVYAPSAKEANGRLIVKLKARFNYTAEEVVACRGSLLGKAEILVAPPLLVEQVEEHTQVVYWQLKRNIKSLFSKETMTADFCTLWTLCKLADGRWAHCTRSVEHAAVPPQPGTPRGDVTLGGWLIESMTPEITSVTMYFNLDFKGMFDEADMRASHTGLFSYRNLKTALDENRIAGQSELGMLHSETAVRSALDDLGKGIMRNIDTIDKVLFRTFGDIKDTIKESPVGSAVGTVGTGLTQVTGKVVEGSGKLATAVVGAARGSVGGGIKDPSSGALRDPSSSAGGAPLKDAPSMGSGQLLHPNNAQAGSPKSDTEGDSSHSVERKKSGLQEGINKMISKMDITRRTSKS